MVLPEVHVFVADLIGVAARFDLSGIIDTVAAGDLGAAGLTTLSGERRGRQGRPACQGEHGDEAGAGDA